MREHNVVEMFKRVVGDFPVYTLRNNVASGWPDKLVQLGSRVALVELKHVVLNMSNYFRLNEFRQDQAAHFAKWQKEGGICFLFIGVSNTANKALGYGALTTSDWKEWLVVNKAQFELSDLDVFSGNVDTLSKWFLKRVNLW